jgi:hypothetical protein
LAKKRSFTYDGSKGRYPKPNFTVVTRLTDKQAIKLLGGTGGPGTDGDTFDNTCAFEIHRMSEGATHKPNLVAWGFKKAEQYLRPEVTLSEITRKTVAFRRPLKGIVDGSPFRVSVCGENSKRRGSYSITDGGGFRDGQFYGYATPEGKWKPIHNTPMAIIKRLTEE